MIVLQVFLLLIGLALLVKGADWFVDGGSAIAKKCRISPLIIGLTLVAFGTSMPELAVSVASAASHSTDISVGNVVGSNISNILLILGASALVHNLPVRRESLWLDFPVLLIASVLIVVLGWAGGQLVWYDGLIFLAVFSVYMVILFRHALSSARKQTVENANLSDLEPKEVAAEEEVPKSRYKAFFDTMEEKTWFLIVLTIVGLGMVVGGGVLLVNAAREIAVACHVSERIIGLTVVAIGTSLPELVTSVVAAVKGETDIAVGNIIGSNVFNIFMVAGVASLVYPLAFTTANLIDALVALGAAVLLYGLSMFRGHKLGKVAGGVLLAGFIAYYCWLFVA